MKRPTDRRNARFLALDCLAVGFLGVLLSGMLAAAPPRPERDIRLGFWLAVQPHSMLSDDTLDFVGRRASLVVINGGSDVNPYFNHAGMLRRFKAVHPEVPVLTYDWYVAVNMAADEKAGEFGSSRRSKIEAARKHPDWIIRNTQGTPYQSAHAPDWQYFDLTDPAFRAWFLAQEKGYLDGLQADGVAFDAAAFEPPWAGPPAERKKPVDPSCCLDGPRIQREYAAAVHALLGGVKDAVAPRLVIFNSIHSKWSGDVNPAAEGRLVGTDGGSVEFFANPNPVFGNKGYRLLPSDNGMFDHLVMHYGRVMARHADKIMPVFARAMHGYTDYSEDYQQQRFGLACYLLVRTPESLYKYHEAFGVVPPVTAKARTDGLSYFADYDLPVGEPVGPYEEQNDVFIRRYTRALVAVAPWHLASGQVALERRYFTPEGAEVSDTAAVPAGRGLILLADKPTPPPETVRVDGFESGAIREWKWPVKDQGVRIEAEGANHYLRIEPTEGDLFPYHERNLVRVKRLQPYATLSLRLRTRDASSVLLTRVEISDHSRPAGGRDPREPFAVVALVPENGTQRFAERAFDIPCGKTYGGAKVHWLTVPGAYRASGQWQTVRFDIAAALKRALPQLEAWRLCSLRVLGAVDLDDVTVEQSSP